MSDEEKFLNLINTLARMCNFELDQEIIDIYDQQLSPHGYDKINQAMQDIFVNRNSRDPFPSIAEILRHTDAQVSDKSQADNVCAIIFSAFKKWSTNYCGQERFQQMYIDQEGELTWAVVQKMGGYNHLYNEWNLTKNMSSFRAQVRDVAKSVIELSRAGKLWTPPALPENKSKRLQQLVGSTVKTIGGKSDR